jgi:hypothetical protein
MQIVEQTRRDLDVPYAALCQKLRLPYSSLMRWRHRREAGASAVGKPGPSKAEPLDLEGLHREIQDLDHGPQRTHGTGALYERHREEISRRDLHELVEATRRELRQEEQALERRVVWLVPGAVWSMDDTKQHWLNGDCLRGSDFGHAHLVFDLGSRYNLRLLGAEVQANGWKVAANLEDLFQRHGAPLFLKMDGGKNFAHHEVRRVLAEAWVIPLVSPPYYPPYNGSVERAIAELLRHLGARIGSDRLNPRELSLECELSGHEVNHKRRRSLGGQTACRALESGRALSSVLGRRDRKEVFEQIEGLAVDIAAELDQHSSRVHEIAFRYAAETWMQENNVIRVTRNGEVLPSFYRFQSH